MNPERLVETLIRGALGGRRKKSRGAMRFLTGGRGSWLNASTLLAAAGVAWGLYEAATSQGATPAASPQAPGPTPSVGMAPGSPPALPGAAPTVAAARESQPGGTGAGHDGQDVPVEVLRVIRLTIAAARADGALTPAEHDTILAHARAAGAESLVASELQQPTPLAALVAGAPPEHRRDLYTLAFAIARADEAVSGGERIFLAQLAHQLGLDAAAIEELERAATERISASAAEDHPKLQ